MKYLLEGDEYELSTGKQFYANKGIIGIENSLIISHGYDGGINEDDFTQQEKAEIADYMIDLWTKFKEVK